MKFPCAIVRALALACVASALAMHAVAGEYPSKPITIIVPYAPGGGGDIFTRAIAAQAQEIFDTRIFVENRTGGGGTIGVGSVARAEGDGYTLAFVSTSPVVVSPNFLSVPYDPAMDLTYLSRFVLSYNPVLVRADSPFDSFKKLLGFARVNPGRLRWATAGINGAPHLATDAAFKQEGIKAAFVPMQGSTEVMAGLLGGTLDMGVISDYATPLAAGEIRVLAEIGPDIIPELPDIPTFKQMNYPLAPTIFYGLAGPAGLSQEVIGKWDVAMQTITSSDQFSDVVGRLSAQLAYLDHQAFHELVLKDIESMRDAFTQQRPGSFATFHAAACHRRYCAGAGLRSADDPERTRAARAAIRRAGPGGFASAQGGQRCGDLFVLCLCRILVGRLLSGWARHGDNPDTVTRRAKSACCFAVSGPDPHRDLRYLRAGPFNPVAQIRPVSGFPAVKTEKITRLGATQLIVSREAKLYRTQRRPNPGYRMPLRGLTANPPARFVPGKIPENPHTACKKNTIRLFNKRLGEICGLS